MTSTLSTYRYIIKNQLIKLWNSMWKPVENVERVLSFHMFPHTNDDKVLKMSVGEMWKV